MPTTTLRKKNSRRLNRKQSGLHMESLEDRKLMAANLMADLNAGVLRIEGTERNDSIIVRQVDNRISVDSIRIRENGSFVSNINAASVARIDVFALGGGDRILLNSDAVSGQQHITKPSRIWGGSGNDTIVGGSGNDEIWGGADVDKIWGSYGDDKIYGESGNDELVGGYGHDLIFGGSGQDKLWGGEGNDSLYGGNDNDDLMGGNGHDGLYGGAGTDRMWGEGGNDRFLVMSGSTEQKDAASSDAVLVFKNGNKSWNASEIEQLDAAFRQLHHKTLNDRLLETSSRGTVTIVRDASSGTVRGANFNNGTIKMYDAAFQNSVQAAQTMLHEMGHNFDTEGVNWNAWLTKSSWRDSAPSASVAYLYAKSGDAQWWYLKSARFARDYGKQNPREDWATAWESYFKYKHNMPTDTSVSALASSKTQHLDDFFARMS